MKKKLLFVIPNLGSGGAEKSLISLLSNIDYDKYEVDMFLFRKEGMFLSQIPEKVNAVLCNPDFRFFDGPAGKAFVHFLLKGRLDILLARKRYAGEFRKNSPYDPLKVWQCMSKCFSPLKKEYDVSIGYLEGFANYFALDMVRAKKYIAYVHTDYSKNDFPEQSDKVYFPKFDKIVTVSENCLNALAEIFPEERDKFTVVENISSKKNIMALAESEDVDLKKDCSLALLTIGRFCWEKALDTAIDTCVELVGRGVDFKWYHVGDGGPVKAKILKYCKDKHMSDRFIMLGEKSNPYPYIKACDIYVQPSKVEGKSIAIDEAMLLEKPILVSNFPTAKDQITDGVTGIITEHDPVALADKIVEMSNDSELCRRLSENLKEHTGNEEEIEKFYALIND
ncbi:MAG: glycosyltransferase [Clostridiales bacterium]|nr:glycosyltransferase [Clostridiales bacterium]